MEKQVLEIIKDKDDWKFTVEIKESAKGELQVSIKTRSDESAKEAGNEALQEFRRVKEELSSPDASDLQEIGSLTCKKEHTHTKRCLN